MRTYTNVSFLERRIVTLYGLDSNALKALDLITNVMCVENGFQRDDGSDYYTHCVDVANTLISYGIKDEDVVCAALLHDIIENVEGYKEITLEKLFNANISRLVHILTKEHGVDYREPDNLKKYIADIQSDANAAAIKTSDRMHNMMTLNNKTFESRYRKAQETKINYLKKIILPLLKKLRINFSAFDFHRFKLLMDVPKFKYLTQLFYALLNILALLIIFGYLSL